MIRWLRNWVGGLAWPSYKCQFCIGQEPQHGCYCSYHECFGPSNPEGTRAQRFARKVYSPLFSWYDQIEAQRCQKAHERQQIADRVTAELKGKAEKVRENVKRFQANNVKLQSNYLDDDRYDDTSYSGPAS